MLGPSIANRIETKGATPENRMRARIAIPVVEVSAPDGTRSFWAAYSIPHGKAVAAVRQKIPADHTAELSVVRLPQRWKPDNVRPGDVIELEFDSASSRA